jgi:hypothetical protein
MIRGEVKGSENGGSKSEMTEERKGLKEKRF